jgi:signal transduction histidine kinase
VHGFFLSIDDLKRTQNDLLEAHLLAEAGNVAKRQFMTKMSHELRTPLNGLLGMTGLLLDGELSDQQREYLLLVRQTGEELFDALSEILLYADESSPKPDAQWEEFLLQDLIWEEIRAITPRAQRKGLTIDCEMKDLNSQRFFSDSKRLRHILSALLSNALKFTDSGRIEVWASSRPSFVSSYPMVTIAVSDTGIGIPRDLQATIFEPFAEANTTLRTEAKGTGLGLATVKSAVSALHGTVKFESEPGKGSKFIVEIPMRAAPSNVIPSVPAEPILV